MTNKPIRKSDPFKVNNVDEAAGSIIYVGREDPDGRWYISKIDESSNPIPIQYASIKNNSTRTTYSTAWTNRTTLTYQDYSNAF